ncbi:MAG TPA: AMP-binding protein [Mycobacteriales bacterium]|nr:AMP-binding protein [Mycobacteriales bacterium]
MTGYDERPWLAAYPTGVPADFDFPQEPLTRLLDDAADGFPGSVAISCMGVRTTYRELREQVDRLAGGLATLGVHRGDRVAVILPNCPQHVVAMFAVLRLGAVVTHCNPLAPAHELRQQLRDAGAEVVVCLDRTVPTVLEVRADCRVRSVVATSLADALSPRARTQLRLPTPAARAKRARYVAELPDDAAVVGYRNLLRRARPAAQATVDPARDVAVLQYTGGTTGEPKAAMLSHANLVANSYQMRLWLPQAVPGREVTLAVLPLFHVYGLTLCLLTTVLLAGRLVLIPRFDLDAVFGAIDEERPTLLPGVPPIYQAILDSPRLRRHDLRSIRACVSGAMKLPVETRERFERATGGRLVEGYGMTETSPATHCVPLAGDAKPGSVGVPLPGTSARIVDPENPSVVVTVGEPGELAVKGPQVFLGYWTETGDPVSVTSDGWLLTGDIVTMDPDGWFTIVDRKKDLIIAGGFNISPTEVEEVIRTLPGVADCCVAGLPDRYRGETVKAYVVAADGAELTEADVQSHCAARLTAYKVPKLVEFRAELPHTAVGKALRRQLVAEELAAAEDV